jgi:putative RecB family exonuclease
MMSEPKLVAPDRLSPSSISTFRQCPLKFKYSKIDGLPDAPTDATVLGNFVHEVLETMYALPPEQRTQETAKSLARQLWADSWGEKAASLIHSEKELNFFRWTAWWCIENLWRLEDPINTSPWAIEEHVEGVVGGIRLHGYIDRLFYENGVAKISDYKTGKTPKPKYMGDKFFQLIIYSQLLESIDIIPESMSLELLYLKDGVRFEKVVSQEDVQEVIEVIQEVREGIDSRCKSGEFEPNKSILCNWCGYKRICPAWQ